MKTISGKVEFGIPPRQILSLRLGRTTRLPEVQVGFIVRHSGARWEKRGAVRTLRREQFWSQNGQQAI